MEQSKHKAPTQITIVQEEKSAYASFVHRHWRLGALAAVVASVAILVAQYQGQTRREHRNAEWDTYVEAQASGDPADLLEAAAALEGTGIDAWAALQATQVYIDRREYDRAEGALERAARSNAALVSRLTLPIGEDGADLTLVEGIRGALARQREQDAALAERFTNPPPPEDAPRVALEVEVGGRRGTITIGLYPDQAPLHVENFLKLVEAGDYDGVKFHRVIRDFMIQTGDPNTKDPNKPMSTWGQGGPDYKIEPETSELVHAPYAVAAAKGQEPESSGSQFYITTGAPHFLDGIHTVFGMVIEGRDMVDAIEGVKIRPREEEVPPDVPVAPVPTILKARRL